MTLLHRSAYPPPSSRLLISLDPCENNSVLSLLHRFAPSNRRCGKLEAHMPCSSQPAKKSSGLTLGLLLLLLRGLTAWSLSRHR